MGRGGNSPRSYAREFVYARCSPSRELLVGRETVAAWFNDKLVDLESPLFTEGN